MGSHRKPLVNRHRLQTCAIPSRIPSHVGFASGVLRIGAVILLPASGRLRINFVSGLVHNTKSSHSVQRCVSCPCSTYSMQPPNCLCGVVYTANYGWMAKRSNLVGAMQTAAAQVVHIEDPRIEDAPKLGRRGSAVPAGQTKRWDHDEDKRGRRARARFSCDAWNSGMLGTVAVLTFGSTQYSHSRSGEYPKITFYQWKMGQIGDL